jgi:hypothetical protein
MSLYNLVTYNFKEYDFDTMVRSLFLASTSWLENVCYLAKEIINAKIV